MPMQDTSANMTSRLRGSVSERRRRRILRRTPSTGDVGDCRSLQPRSSKEGTTWHGEVVPD
jgi:hypothetical protein